MGKKTGSLKRKRKDVEEEQTAEIEEIMPPAVVKSDEPIPKKEKWTNKTRVLVFSCRGVSYRDRHLMLDLRSFMPHAKPENKIERQKDMSVINDICAMKNCDKVVLLEGRQKRDLYMWMSNVSEGPSVKFLVESVYTMQELKLTGNCLKGSRPLLSFDTNFTEPHMALMKELFVQIFGTPYYHPKSQPFVDRVMSFSVHDNRIWVRNYQIVTEDGALAEIGPRFILKPIKIFDGSFCGETIWENPHYTTPASFRRHVKLIAADKYLNRKQQKQLFKSKKPTPSYPIRPEDELLNSDPKELAMKIVEERKKKDENEEEDVERDWNEHKLFKPNTKKASIPKVTISTLRRGRISKRVSKILRQKAKINKKKLRIKAAQNRVEKGKKNK